jgi:hypothetical protein
LAGSVRFSFISKKLKKPNRTKTGKNRKKPSQTGKTEPNQLEPVFALKKQNRTEPKLVGLTRFRFGFGFFFLNSI